MVDGLPNHLGDLGGDSILDGGIGIVDIDQSVSPVGVGSPSTRQGNMIQAGSDTTGAGSSVTVVFGDAFGDIPFVVASPLDSQATLRVTGIVAGSALVETSAANEAFNWVAIGSGRP